MKTSRQSFVLGVMGACTAGFLNAACGSDDEPGNTNSSTGGSKSTSTGGSTSGGGACTVVISKNHKHEMKVSAADQAAGVAKEYDITGMASHTHKVSLSAADFADLADGTIVVITSTEGGGHTHDVEITC
jgi:ABC-type phosphate transport system substrate-binding protein